MIYSLLSTRSIRVRIRWGFVRCDLKKKRYHQSSIKYEILAFSTYGSRAIGGQWLIEYGIQVRLGTIYHGSPSLDFSYTVSTFVYQPTNKI